MGFIDESGAIPSVSGASKVEFEGLGEIDMSSFNNPMDQFG